MAQQVEETIQEEQQQEHGFELADTVSKTELFIENNKKTIMYVVLGVVLVVGLFFTYKKVYIPSLDNDAREQMFIAERYFEVDSFNLAIKGDGKNAGFLKVINDFGGSKSANLAHYYAGMSYLHLGQFDKAIEHLQDFDGGDTQIGLLAIGAIGDAYLEKGQTDQAISYYEKVSDKKDAFSAPIFLKKAALAYEKSNKFDKALAAYETIKNEYPRSYEARMVEKYVTRAKLKSTK